MDLKQKIRTIPDFPEPGILFRDITTLLSDAEALNETIERFAEHYKNEKIDVVVGVESRGFIIGTPLAIRMGLGFIPIRKAGKLPGPTHGVDYDLEYGKDRVEVHQDAIPEGSRVLLVDDLIATGGTIEGSAKLVKKVGGLIVGYAFVIELTDLKGRERLQEPVFSLIEFEGH
ncbi:MAG: adenine phosphoribosyltransferase [SAR324 cluster bacterium]|jgi:adenine phosphoribosyltransferase|nr:adenine phosphoribosyltransferase [SAR324 cluster bacterium]HJL88215.1 adenine phosphoribosyltransferase [SAR324 cluster bacterium]|tara:strand:+ start:11558 stop:12076 length:519 start_codon:yes stop_codon:yes gene_type:complete